VARLHTAIATLAGCVAAVFCPFSMAEETASPDAVAAAAQANAADAGVPEADAGAPASESSAPAAESGGGDGLFEQSIAAAAPGNSSAGAKEPAFQLGGYTRGDLFVGKVPGYRQGNIKAGYGELALVARSKKESFGDAFAEARVRYGMLGEQDQTATLDVREAYVNGYFGPLQLRLGKQIIVWGRADLLNPTNNITPIDFRMRSPIEDDRRIGNVGARAFLRLSPFRVEGVWMPTYAPTELPQVTLPQYVELGSPNYPKPELDRGLYAGRIHLELPAIEMSASYLRGYAPLPALAWNSITFSTQNPSAILARTAYRQQVVGFDFSTAISDIVAIRGEAAYRRPYTYDDNVNVSESCRASLTNLCASTADYANVLGAIRPDLQYALGADHSFGSVSVIAQYLGRYTFDWQKEQGSADVTDTSRLENNSPSGVDRSGAQDIAKAQLRKTNQILFSQTARVQHLATVRVEWLTLHDTLSLSALGMMNFTTKEWLASPKIGYHMSDSLVAYLGAEILTGPTGTLFGLVDQQLSAGYVELRSTF